MATQEKAKALGFTPKAYLREWTFVSCDPFDEMLLGPAYATNKVLEMAGMQLSDFGVIEFHEAFAGQVLSNVKVRRPTLFSAPYAPPHVRAGARPPLPLL